MKLVIGSDKSGFALKEEIKAHLKECQIDFVEIGTMSMEVGVPYYEVAQIAGKGIQSGEYDKAILICGTGAGMSVIANKFKGVYAVPCESVYSAKKCRAINNANVMSMGGWVVGGLMAIDMVNAFIHTEFLQDLEDFRKVFLTNAEKEVKKFEDTL